jgi:hypothetical protein
MFIPVKKGERGTENFGKGCLRRRAITSMSCNKYPRRRIAKDVRSYFRTSVRCGKTKEAHTFARSPQRSSTQGPR